MTESTSGVLEKFLCNKTLYTNFKIYKSKKIFYRIILILIISASFCENIFCMDSKMHNAQSNLKSPKVKKSKEKKENAKNFDLNDHTGPNTLLLPVISQEDDFALFFYGINIGKIYVTLKALEKALEKAQKIAKPSTCNLKRKREKESPENKEPKNLKDDKRKKPEKEPEKEKQSCSCQLEQKL